MTLNTSKHLLPPQVKPMTSTKCIIPQRAKSYIEFGKNVRPNLVSGKLNQVLSPAGSGKTHMIKQLVLTIKANNPYKHILISHPYRVSRYEYEQISTSDNADVRYFMKDVTAAFKSMKGDDKRYANTDAYLKAYRQAIDAVLQKARYYMIILDEIDFFFIQAQANPYPTQFTDNADQVIRVLSENLVYITLQSMAANCQYLISISANTFVIPDRVLNLKEAQESIINTIKVDITPNTTVNSFTVIDSTKMDRRTFTFTKKALIAKKSNHASVVFSSKFSPSELNYLKAANAHIVVRDKNIPREIDPTEGGVMMPLTKGYKNFILVGNKDGKDLLNDAMIEQHKMVGINTSSSRSVSLNNDYGLATVIILSNQWTATTAQVCARFRNTPVDIIWLTNNPSSLLKETTDVFKDNWIPTITFVNNPLKHYGLTIGNAIGKAKGKSNQATLDKRAKMLPFVNNPEYKTVLAAFKAYRLQEPKGYALKAFRVNYKALTS